MEPRGRYRIDDHLVRHLSVSAGDVVVELGCGSGVTLSVAAEQAHDVSVIGFDLNGDDLADARRLLVGARARCLVAVADLTRTLPLADASVTRLICHNVLEQLPDPQALFTEASRVMRARAISVWSHTDFESVIVSGGPPELTQRIVHAYANLPDSGAHHADGQLGRKLAAMAASSPLERVAVDAHVLATDDLSGLGRLRVRSIFALVRDAGLAGQVDVTIDELEQWMAALEAAARNNEFFYAQTTFMVVAVKP